MQGGSRSFLHVFAADTKGSSPFVLGDPTGARAPYWPEESKETGGFVAHTLLAKYSVLYLLRTLTLERDVCASCQRFQATAEQAECG